MFTSSDVSHCGYHVYGRGRCPPGTRARVVVFMFGKTSPDFFFHFILIYSDQINNLKSLGEKV